MDLNNLIPDVTEQQQELAVIRSNFADIQTKEDHDRAVDGIRQAKAFVDRVADFFEPFEKPLKEALEALRSRKKALIDPAEIYQKEYRQRCAVWQAEEIKRLKEAEQAAIQASKAEVMPWEEPAPPPALVSTTAASNGATLRKKPWDVRITDEDKLWEATLANPSLYRQYWTPNMPVLKAKAKQQMKMFAVAGCEAFRESTLVVK